MRLVDADALLKRKGCVYDSEGHVLFAVGTGDIVHAPTIDAIQVEWLKRKSLDANDPFSPYMMVMFTWYQEQKEQEAQDG